MTRYAEVVFNIPVDKAFLYCLPDDVCCRWGYRVVAPLGKRKLTGFVVSVRAETIHVDYEIRPLHRVIDRSPLINKALFDLAQWISRTYMCSLGEALSTITPSAKREVDNLDLYPETTGELSRSYALAQQQTGAIETILKNRNRTFYLQGVTGSGKTEVFLQVARTIFEEGRGIIYLVPEISLVHQVVEVFASEFGQKVAVLHSGMTASQRLKEWLNVLEGNVRIVIGARSAVFAPVQNLGLIVIDEEHETSYKSGSAPRYHARQIALYRCQKEEALLVMGSATPSTDAYHRMNIGHLVRISLPERLSGGSFPEIEVVDMKREKGVLSRRLIESIRSVHREGRQTILFLNRRGFAYLFYCRSCGYEMKCRRCSVSLTYHKEQNLMICHYCGFRTDPLEVCPECGSLDIGYSGFGTERIEQEIKSIFPELSLKRIDTDVVRKKRELQKILRSFREGMIDLLLGTQMVAKGLNFPGVKLVGIVSADVGLQLPDFRALERTFALIVQVSGRAGRMTSDGRVIVQTFRPENSVIIRATRGKYHEFYEEELKMRQLLRFPPFVRLIRVVIRGRDKGKALGVAKQLYEFYQERNQGDVEILGPVECPFSRIAGNWRFHMIFRGNDFQQVHAGVYALYRKYVPPRGVFLEYDVDPLSLL
jgi:primosomal protein N' (replication factor Y)